ncbi:MAG TPA: hypothetical protein PKV55_05340 [Nitrospira sp.]|jgi:hypothetical protein|nr:hypothetical protein [Nitrospira sp.]HNO32801.1 hypothetical protein [Nitrospira sp.]
MRVYLSLLQSVAASRYGAWRAVDTIANYPDLLGILEACRVTLS